MIWGIVAIVLVLAADQFSKYLIDSRLTDAASVFGGDYFNLVKVWNTGVSFSLFNNHGTLGMVVLSTVSLLVSVVLFNWMRHETNRWKIVALGMIIGGALGNVIDRIRFGAVLDFLDFHYQTHHWPAFNVADSFICVGAFVLIFWELYHGHKKGFDKL